MDVATFLVSRAGLCLAAKPGHGGQAEIVLESGKMQTWPGSVCHGPSPRCSGISITVSRLPFGRPSLLLVGQMHTCGFHRLLHAEVGAGGCGGPGQACWPGEALPVVQDTPRAAALVNRSSCPHSSSSKARFAVSHVHEGERHRCWFIYSGSI